MMKSNFRLFFMLGATLVASGCSLKKDEAVAKTAQSQARDLGNPADQVGVPGVPGAAVPTKDAIIARIQTGLEGKANPTLRNFRAAILQLSVNLPQDTNPNLATGLDQVPLLAYAACSDVLPSAYGITGSSIPAARGALIAAGVKIVDAHTAGLGSSGPLAPQVAQIFGKLVDENTRVAGETVQMAFISVCMTASTFGAQMMGF